MGQITCFSLLLHRSRRRCCVVLLAGQWMSRLWDPAADLAVRDSGLDIPYHPHPSAWSEEYSAICPIGLEIPDHPHPNVFPGAADPAIDPAIRAIELESLDHVHLSVFPENRWQPQV